MLSRYRILSQLGSGGMGVVYRAEDVTLKRPVALKFLSGTSLSQEQIRARFLREAQTAASLNHPNVCTIHEIGEVQRGEEEALGAGEPLEAGTPFIAMEMIDGQTLEELGRRSGSLLFDELLGIALQIADGMAAAHARGIAHRDLKPGNVMLTKEGRVKILDFGLAKPLEPAEPGDAAGTTAATASAELTREGRVIGTAAYMSPEQAKGESVDSRSDIFSFGVMLYELATGTRPFRGTTTISTLAKIIEAEPEPIPEKRSDIPLELRRIVRRCLQKRPEDRYNDTRDLVAALKALRQETTSGAARMVSASASTAKPAPSQLRRRVIWVFTAAVGIAVIAIVSVVFWPKGGAHPKPGPVTHRQVTFTGNAFSPDMSPDGKSILYVTRTYGQKSKLIVQDVSGGQPLQVYVGDLLWARWSPSGTEVLVIERGEGKLRSAAIIPRLGGPANRLHPPVRSNTNWYPAWSPDGKRVAIGTEAGDIAVTEVATGASKVVRTAAPEESLYELDWSPRSGFLAAVMGNRGGSQIVTVAEDSGSQNTVFQGDVGHAVRWAAAGSGLYFLKVAGQTTDLWKFPVDPTTGKAAGEPVQLLTGFTLERRLSIPKDGRTVAVARVTANRNLWLVEREAGRGAAPLSSRPLTTGTQQCSGATLSPDGRTVAFVAGPGGKKNVFTMVLPDGAARQMTFLEGDCSDPAWSPDGTKIAFLARKGGTNRVWTVDAEGGPPRTYEVTSPRGYLIWAPGPRIVYLQASGRNFNVLDPETEKEEPLLRGESPGWFQSPCVAPDGRRFAVRWNRPPHAQVWLVTQGGDPPRILLDRAWALPMGWSSDGKAIYVNDETDEPFGVVRVPVDGGLATTLFDLPFDAIEGAVSPDGTKFAFTRVDTTSDVWLAENFDPAVWQGARSCSPATASSRDSALAGWGWSIAPRMLPSKGRPP